MKKRKGSRGVCVDCGKAGLVTTTETRRYGLVREWSVAVEGARVARCPACGYEGVGFDASGGIERAVAEQVIGKSAHLAGEEIVFFRELLDWTGRKLAATLGIGPSTLSRWEHGHETITGPADRLLRMLAAIKLGIAQTWSRQQIEVVLEGIKDEAAPPLKVRARMTERDGQRKAAA